MGGSGNARAAQGESARRLAHARKQQQTREKKANERSIHAEAAEMKQRWRAVSGAIRREIAWRQKGTTAWADAAREGADMLPGWKTSTRDARDEAAGGEACGGAWGESGEMTGANPTTQPNHTGANPTTQPNHREMRRKRDRIGAGV